MNITFLIGNGFDLNMELKTRYSDFYSEYINIHSENPAIRQFKKDISSDIKTWADFELEFGKYIEKYNAKNKNDIIVCRDDFLEEFIYYLRRQEQQINYKNLENEIIEKFKNSLRGFHEKLSPESQQIFINLYSNYSQERTYYHFISFNYTNILDNCIDLIRNAPVPKMQTSNQKIIAANDIRDIIHIHGTVDEDTILGVDNSTQIFNDELAKDKTFTRLVLKPEINKKLRNRKIESVISILNASTVICVFGMSIGETDKTWWQYLGKWLLNDKHHLVFFDVIDKYNKIHTSQTIRSVDKIINHFYNMADFPDDKRDLCESRIHIGFNTGLFKVDLTRSMDDTEKVELIEEKELLTV